jgi:hypothetical protein
MTRRIVQQTVLYTWSDGTYTVWTMDMTAPDGENTAHYDRTPTLGIALTRVLRANLPYAEVKVATRPT